jgi:hypothetical protein
MEVVGNDGPHVGVIVRVEAEEIKLARNDAPTSCSISSRSPMSNMLTIASISTEAAFARWRNGVDDWE